MLKKLKKWKKLWLYRLKIKTITVNINGTIRKVCWIEVDQRNNVVNYCCREGKIFPCGSESLEFLSFNLND